MAMLDIRGMTCVHGSVVAASDVDLHVDAGQILALIGANGAGKTSTLMAAMGHVRIVTGTVVLAGTDIAGRDARVRPVLGMAVVPEGRHLFRDLTVDENLTVGGYTQPRSAAAQARARVFDLFPRLAERRTQVAGSLSGGRAADADDRPGLGIMRHASAGYDRAREAGLGIAAQLQ